MSASPQFDLAFDPRYGDAVRLSPLIRRVTANNPGPFTFHGTNSYLVGNRQLAVIDPGPLDAAHLNALLRAVGDAEVVAILVTHTHRDHSPLSYRLARHTGAPVLAEGPHRLARPLAIGETEPLDGSGDTSFRPDCLLSDGETVSGDGWRLTAIATPGHTANHLAFALEEESALFSGDHVMAWSTTIVAPPDGSMVDYMASLDRLLARTEERYYPGHGAFLHTAQRFVADLRVHRLGREAAILKRLEAGDVAIPDMVRAIYVGLDAKLAGAAGLSVLAHLEDLVARGVVSSDGVPGVAAHFRPA
ncbi:MAG: MBL fold metallo-hydrolase [Ancalomicrobiaceae bacterium]|nr:MBL fold metallo-hydrolase [Ancalomicrobiaceae bacterium]